MQSPIFLAAPHRVMFAGGAIQLLLAFGLWAAELLLRAAGQGLTLPAALPSALWHPLLMVFGFFPFFIFGFLMTALPRWVGAGALAGPAYLRPFALMLGGWLLFHAGMLAGSAVLAGAGAIVVAGGWVLGAHALGRAAAVAHPDKRHARTVIALVVVGAACLCLAGVGVASGEASLLRAATLAGLWGFLVPVFVVVSHRMLPFFSQGTIPGTTSPPMSALWILLVCLGIHAIAATGLAGGGFAIVATAGDALAAGVALQLTWRWQLARSFANRLLATHHVAFAWLGIALAASAMQGLLAQFAIDLGRTLPVHALGAGFLLSMVLGMATRVTLGHSGLPIVAPPGLWTAFWGLQAAIVLRLLADLAPAAIASPLFVASAAIVLGVFGDWARRHLGLFFRPRADGAPG